MSVRQKSTGQDSALYLRGYFSPQEGVGRGTSIPGRCRSSSSVGRQPAGSGDAGTHQTPATHTNRLIAAAFIMI